jgi:hypothetical protein
VARPGRIVRGDPSKAETLQRRRDEAERRVDRSTLERRQRDARGEHVTALVDDRPGVTPIDARACRVRGRAGARRVAAVERPSVSSSAPAVVDSAAPACAAAAGALSSSSPLDVIATTAATGRSARRRHR